MFSRKELGRLCQEIVNENGFQVEVFVIENVNHSDKIRQVYEEAIIINALEIPLLFLGRFGALKETVKDFLSILISYEAAVRLNTEKNFMAELVDTSLSDAARIRLEGKTKLQEEVANWRKAEELLPTGINTLYFNEIKHSYLRETCDDYFLSHKEIERLASKLISI